jgi:hypothetical protein
LVPAAPFRPGPAVSMVAAAALCAVVSGEIFRPRDLTGA